jgi:hypothetical protein
MGPEGAAQIANVYQAGREAEAQTAQQQAQINFDVDAAKAQAAQNIEYRNLERQRELESMRLAGAQQKAAEKRAAGQQAVAGLIGGLGMAAGDILGLSAFDYGSAELKANMAARQANRAKRKAVNSGEYFSFDQSTPAYMGDFNILPE